MTDVAKRAGVSQTTVSFVINNVGSANIAAETKERVWQAVRDLGYRRNNAAKMLRTNTSHVIGFITDRIATTPFAGEVIRSAHNAALERDKIVMLIDTQGDAETEARAIETLLERQVEAIIYAAMYTKEVAPPASLREVPTVLVNCFEKERTLPTVVPDEVYGGQAVTELLIGEGHRRIGFINGPNSYYAAGKRLEGYRRALAGARLEFDPTLVKNGNWWPDNGYKLTKMLLKQARPPTALFCGNDRMAMGAYQALAELGLRVPTDVAVVGYDGDLISRHLAPPLTTFTLPHAGMGKWAIERLTSGVARDPVLEYVRGKLVRRASHAYKGALKEVT